MKVPYKTKSIWLLLILALMLSGCASTTMLTTVPPGARVYVKGEALGTTPYKYSDTRTALSSTFITFKKQGFKDLGVTLRRNEQPAWGAIIGGVFIYVPLLWFAEYKPNHFYELERASGTELNEAFYSKTDTLIKSEIDKIAAVEKPEENLPDMTDTSLYNPAESPGLDFSKRKISQFGIGLGLCTWAMFFGMDYTYIGPKDNGVNIGWNANMFKTPDIPADYDRSFTPMDYLNTFSINYVRALPTTKNDVRFRLEAGPSCVFYSKATIVNNPDYDPNHAEDEWFWSFDWLSNSWKHKYNKERSTSSTIGASLAARMEFLVSPSFDLEITLFANLNSLKSIFGLGFFLNFGDVKD